MQKNNNLIAGIDEAGRGPLAGPVIAAVVIFKQDQTIEGLADSKKLSEKKREELFSIIKESSVAWAVGRAEPEEIDSINILQASLLAMKRAYNGLSVKPDMALIDGTFVPDIVCQAEAIIKGDQKIPAISAASIIAKVTRDREMRELDIQYPGYNLSKHKGYPTKDHLICLQRLGPSPIHRTSFGPVKRLLMDSRLRGNDGLRGNDESPR